MPVPFIHSPFIRLDALGMPMTAADWSPETCRDEPRQVVFPMNSAEPDAVQIITRLRQFSEQYGKSPCIFAFARCLIRDVSTNNDRMAHFEAVARFVLDRTVYVPDPRGAEFVRSPVRMISEYQKNGYAQGDCDDFVLLANSLWSALGFKTRAVAVKLPGSSHHNHVLSQVEVNGSWRWFDACNRDDPGRSWTGDIYFSE